ncbi:MAG: PKD domain-containing protein [Gemmatimonadaceae bacterium]
MLQPWRDVGGRRRGGEFQRVRDRSENQPLSYDWNFGDGSPHGSGGSPSHTYADNGSYNVTVTVSDGSLTASSSASAVISNVAPTATFNAPSAVTAGFQFNLSLTNAADP